MNKQAGHDATSSEYSSASFYLADEKATVDFARRLAPLLNGVSFVTLAGDLGAGKTTLARALIHALGYEGRVKSPTYTLVEVYELPERTVFHFDLYRLADPEELEYLGLDDYFGGQALCLVEWASKGEGMLPEADLELSLSREGEGRRLCVRALSPVAREIPASL